jgi:secretion/DNA translocation related CpaE-like protein
MGAETDDGLRWPDVQLSAGRVAASALHMSLPTRRRGNARMTVLSGARQGEGPAPEAVAAVVEAGRRAGEVVVCDVPRQLDVTALQAIDRSDLTAIVTPAEVRACVTAKQLAKELLARGAEVQLIVRGPSPGGLSLTEIAKHVDIPLLATMAAEPQVAQSVERGTFAPKPKGPLSRAARATLAELASMPPKRRGQDLKAA